MAFEIAQSLLDNFMASFDQLYSTLPTEFNDMLLDIKLQFNKENINLSWIAENISTLYHLDEAMADCKLFTMEKKGFFKSLSGTVRLSSRRQDQGRVEADQRRSQQYAKARPIGSTTYPTGLYTYLDPIDSSQNILGFDDYKQKILDRLLRPRWDESRNGFIGIGIHGMCGTRKTTLVKYALEDPEVRDKFKLQKSDIGPKPKSNVQDKLKLQDPEVDPDVDPKSNVQDKLKLQDSDVDPKSQSNVVWVCLSDITSPEELNIKIVKHILEALGHDTDEWTGENTSLTDVGLVDKLREVLKDMGNYIIVLDDLWHCNDWFGSLMVEADGSQSHKRFSHILPKLDGSGCGAVIVTTRIKTVAAKMVGEKNLIHPEPLTKEELMKKIVNRSINLLNQVDEVAHHCHGLPFVATESVLVDKHILPKEKEKEEAASPKEGGAVAEAAEAQSEKSAKDQRINSGDGAAEVAAAEAQPVELAKDQLINSGDRAHTSETKIVK